MTFENVCNNFFRLVEKQHKKQSYDTIYNDFQARIIPYFKNKILSDLTFDDIMSWYTEIENLHFSNRYNRKLYYDLSMFLDYCVLNHLLDKNYLHEIGVFKKHFEIQQADFYTYKEFKLFMKGFEKKDFIYREYFKFMFFNHLQSFC